MHPKPASKLSAAERMVITQISRHPQFSVGAYELIADTALRAVSPYTRGEVGIRELASIRPKPSQAAADRVNRLHDGMMKKYGHFIPMISPTQAGNAVHSHAFGGIRTIAETTRQLAEETGVSTKGLPEGDIYPQWNSPGLGWLQGIVAQRRANKLHNYLTQPGQDDLRERVISQIGMDAQERQEGREQQQYEAATKLWSVAFEERVRDGSLVAEEQ